MKKTANPIRPAMKSREVLAIEDDEDD